MDILKGNICMVDIRDNTCMQYLINNACVLVNRDPKIVAMTNGVRGRGGVPILLVSSTSMGTKG